MIAIGLPAIRAGAPVAEKASFHRTLEVPEECSCVSHSRNPLNEAADSLEPAAFLLSPSNQVGEN